MEHGNSEKKAMKKVARLDYICTFMRFYMALRCTEHQCIRCAHIYPMQCYDHTDDNRGSKVTRLSRQISQKRVRNRSKNMSLFQRLKVLCIEQFKNTRTGTPLDKNAPASHSKQMMNTEIRSQVKFTLFQQILIHTNKMQ